MSVDHPVPRTARGPITPEELPGLRRDYQRRAEAEGVTVLCGRCLGEGRYWSPHTGRGHWLCEICDGRGTIRGIPVEAIER